MYMKRILLMVGMSLAMLIPTSCTEKLNRNSNKVDKTKDWTEVVTMVVSSEIGTVYGMEGVPSEGMKIKEEGKKDWNPAYFSELKDLNMSEDSNIISKSRKLIWQTLRRMHQA